MDDGDKVGQLVEDVLDLTEVLFCDEKSWVIHFDLSLDEFTSCCTDVVGCDQLTFF